MLAGIGCKAKEGWNKMGAGGHVKCPRFCNESAPFRACECSCPVLDQESLTLSETQEILDDLDLQSYIRVMYRYETEDGSWGVNGLTTRQQKQFMEWYLAFACHPGKMGAMSTGASANDPIFWPLHPVFDRIWAFMRLAPRFQHFNWTWVDEHKCEGHDYHDAQPFRNLWGEHDEHLYTNQELFANFDPRRPELQYVYDSFEWDHCSGDVGSAIDTQSDATYDSARPV